MKCVLCGREQKEKIIQRSYYWGDYEVKCNNVKIWECDCGNSSLTAKEAKMVQDITATLAENAPDVKEITLRREV